MKVLAFSLSGRTAFFRKPEVNSYAYFTYNNIHKIALFGLLGSIVGLGGHTQQYDTNSKYPEFYDKLKNIKIGIEPVSKYGVFPKKIQTFNNSVGYASKEVGGNLIVREQWLENPKWEIYIQLDNYVRKVPEKSLLDKLCNYLKKNKCDYIPYLGKNDHFANIQSVRIIEMEEAKDIDHIDSLFPAENVILGNLPYNFPKDQSPYLFKEVAPFKFNKEYTMYSYKDMCRTNFEVEELNEDFRCFSFENKIIAFY